MYVQYRLFCGLAKHESVIVAQLKSVSDPSTPLNQPFQVILPSSSSIGEYWPESQQIVALPHELQKTVSSQTGAIYVGFNLLLSLVNGALPPEGQCTEFASFEHHQPWILDTCFVLWQHFRRWTTGPNKQSFHDETITSYLQVLEVIIVSTKLSEDRPSGSTKLAQSLVRGLSNLLEKPNLPVLNQLQLASLLIRLRAASNDIPNLTSTPVRRSVNSLFIVANYLEANIARFCHAGEKFSGLQKDLQVCITEPSSGHKAHGH
jgi:serine/threonine-protein kinase ATR